MAKTATVVCWYWDLHKLQSSGLLWPAESQSIELSKSFFILSFNTKYYCHNNYNGTVLVQKTQMKACWLERLSMNGLTSSVVAKLKMSPNVIDMGKAGKAFL